MNYLVHLHLAGDNPGHQLGGLIGDFVKGRIPEDFPPDVQFGLYLHRRIDSFSHENRYTRQSKSRLHKKYGHGKGIIVDIFYDHFLASSWSDYSFEPLESFAQSVYRQLLIDKEQLPEEFQVIMPNMIKHNWLVSYRQPEAVSWALEKISKRLRKFLPLSEALEDLSFHEERLRLDFELFMTEAQEFTRHLIKANTL